MYKRNSLTWTKAFVSLNKLHAACLQLESVVAQLTGATPSSVFSFEKWEHWLTQQLLQTLRKSNKNGLDKYPLSEYDDSEGERGW